MPAEKIAIVYNPTAGMGRALKRKLKMERLLRHFEVRYDLYMSRSEDHLRELALNLAKTHRTIVGAGGDSTFHILVNEIVRAGCDVDFGMIGVGSSNDIAKEFGVHSLFQACRALSRPTVRAVDLGCILEGEKPIKYFLGQANIGLGAFVNRGVADLADRKPWLARRQTLAGVLAIRKAYRSKKIPLRLTVQAVGASVQGEFVAAVISNVKYWATGKIVNPGAIPDDGRLDCCLIPDCSFLRLARISFLANTGRHARAKGVRFLQAHRFELASEQPFEIQSDGEIMRTPDGRVQFQKITVAVLPKALKIVCPR
jgi:diacylglycerol kinase (ATP)